MHDDGCTTKLCRSTSGSLSAAGPLVHDYVCTTKRCTTKCARLSPTVHDYVCTTKFVLRVQNLLVKNISHLHYSTLLDVLTRRPFFVLDLSERGLLDVLLDASLTRLPTRRYSTAYSTVFLSLSISSNFGSKHISLLRSNSQSLRRLDRARSRCRC